MAVETVSDKSIASPRAHGEQVALLDSGASAHMFKHNDWIKQDAQPAVEVQNAGGEKQEATSYGTSTARIQGSECALNLQRVLHVPEIRTNLLLVPAQCLDGMDVTLNKDNSYIKKGLRHRRLGHADKEALRKMLSGNASLEEYDEQDEPHVRKNKTTNLSLKFETSKQVRGSAHLRRQVVVEGLEEHTSHHKDMVMWQT